MPLTINLKPHERLIVNGVVIENSGPAAKILVHNNAALLREKDIVTEEQANTPARRIYFAIQCQYLFPAKSDVFLPIIEKFLAEFEQAAPSTAALIAEIGGHVRDGQFYRALKSAKQLITREQEILDDASAKGLPKSTRAR
ncbi:MAG TPA: flagellar biosynthesis repressor FlbT [Stellaceae bacterium]|nr:flagellar biosynthesis repressor FlbT [Stellaceae bacterium]